MDKIEYCKSIQSDHYLELVTTYFEETMSLYNIGHVANRVIADVGNDFILYKLTFIEEDEAKKAEEIILNDKNPISNYDKMLRVFSVSRSGKELSISFKH